MLLLVVACGEPAVPPASPTPPAPAPDAAPPPCFYQTGLQLAPPTLVAADTPKTIAIPQQLGIEVVRSGKDRVIYSVSVCGKPLRVDKVEKSTGFPRLDSFLDKQLGIFITPPKTGCVTANLILTVSRYNCEPL